MSKMISTLEPKEEAFLLGFLSLLNDKGLAIPFGEKHVNLGFVHPELGPRLITTSDEKADSLTTTGLHIPEGQKFHLSLADARYICDTLPNGQFFILVDEMVIPVIKNIKEEVFGFIRQQVKL